MNSETPSSFCSMTLTFLAGAVLGGVVVALATPKSGPHLRGDLEHMARRAKRKVGHLAEGAGDAWDALKHRSAHAADHLKRGVAASIHDFHGNPAWGIPEAEVGAPYEGTQ